MDDCLDLDIIPPESGHSSTLAELPEEHEGNPFKQGTYEDNVDPSFNNTYRSDKIIEPKDIDGSEESAYSDYKNSKEKFASFFGQNIDVLDREEFMKRMASMAGKGAFETLNRRRNVYWGRKRTYKSDVRKDVSEGVKKVVDSSATTPPVAEERHDALLVPLGTKVESFNVESFCRDVGFMEDLAKKMGARPLLTVYERKDWGAAPPISTVDLNHPVYYVNFTDTGVGSVACRGEQECLARVKGLQRDHMEKLGLPDIKYNWLISPDGTVYEGRGWIHEGYRPPEIKLGIKSNCMHIAYIGDYSVTEPPTTSIVVGYSFVIEGFHKKYIAKEAKIISKEHAKDIDNLFKKYKSKHNF